MQRLLLVLGLGAVGCNAIFGLEPTRQASDGDADASTVAADAAATDAAATDAAATDATPGPDGSTDCVPIDDQRECTEDLCVQGAPMNPPIARDTPCSAGWCDGAGNCVACLDNLDCGSPIPGACTGYPTCTQGACTTGPAPRDTFCNSSADQCDGLGHCVDCTSNGGCGECCACAAQVCVPV